MIRNEYKDSLLPKQCHTQLQTLACESSAGYTQMQKEQQTAYKCQYIMQTTCSLSCCVCHLLRQPIKATGQPIHRSQHKRPGWISCLWIQQAEDKGGLDTHVHSLHQWGALVEYVTMQTCIVTRYLLSHKSVNTTADQNDNVWLQFQPRASALVCR